MINTHFYSIRCQRIPHSVAGRDSIVKHIWRSGLMSRDVLWVFFTWVLHSTRFITKHAWHIIRFWQSGGEMDQIIGFLFDWLNVGPSTVNFKKIYRLFSVSFLFFMSFSKICCEDQFLLFVNCRWSPILNRRFRKFVERVSVKVVSSSRRIISGVACVSEVRCENKLLRSPTPSSAVRHVGRGRRWYNRTSDFWKPFQLSSGSSHRQAVDYCFAWSAVCRFHG